MPPLSWNCVDVMHVSWCQPFSYDMIKRNLNFQFRFFVFNSNFYFPFSFSYCIENEIETSFFRFSSVSIISHNRLQLWFPFFIFCLFSYGIEKRNLNFDFRFQQNKSLEHGNIQIEWVIKTITFRNFRLSLMKRISLVNEKREKNPPSVWILL